MKETQPQGLTSNQNERATQFYAKHKELTDWLATLPKRRQQAITTDQHNYVSHQERLVPLAHDANLWQSRQHVQENLPSYIEQAQLDYKALQANTSEPVNSETQ